MSRYRNNVDRYNTDPSFKLSVDILYQMILNHGFTPQEVRDMADTASILYAERHIEPQFIEGLKTPEPLR